MGVALAGSGLAGSIMTPLVTATIQSSGWRAGFRQLTIVFFLITIPVILLLIKEHPWDVGQKSRSAGIASRQCPPRWEAPSPA